MSIENDHWKGLLDHDEKIIWQGAPAPGVKLEWSSPFLPVFFLFWTGFSVFWMVMASAAPGPFWMFGLFFFGIGLYNLVGVHFWKAHQRRNTFYTLTSRRAFIGHVKRGKRILDSHPIYANVPLQIEEGAFTDIWFASQQHKGSEGQHFVSKIGFERLENGREVYAKLREIQHNAPQAPEIQNPTQRGQGVYDMTQTSRYRSDDFSSSDD